MPLITFHFTSSISTGEAKQQVQTVLLDNNIPRGARFFIRQVSATSTDTFANSFKFVNVYIPELMDLSQTTFVTYTLTSTGIIPSANTRKGFSYYLTDTVGTPFALNAFPNLNIGRHHLSSPYLTLYLTPYASTNVLGKLASYSVVLEWDTE